MMCRQCDELGHTGKGLWQNDWVQRRGLNLYDDDGNLYYEDLLSGANRNVDKAENDGRTEVGEVSGSIGPRPAPGLRAASGGLKTQAGKGLAGLPGRSQ